MFAPSTIQGHSREGRSCLISSGLAAGTPGQAASFCPWVSAIIVFLVSLLLYLTSYNSFSIKQPNLSFFKYKLDHITSQIACFKSPSRFPSFFELAVSLWPHSFQAFSLTLATLPIFLLSYTLGPFLPQVLRAYCFFASRALS